MNKSVWFLLLFSVCLYADTETTLESITIEEDIASKEEVLRYTKSQQSNQLSKKAKGETLGEYLENELGVDNASYGPAVGRPVVHGMEGYRVGIIQGDVVLNDLSAMSQDHAVGLTPKSTERLELIKGPSSLLYGAYSGGVIRTIGEEHEKTLLPKGEHVELQSSSGSNSAGVANGLKATLSEHNLSAYVTHYDHQSDDYKSGGKTVDASDTSTQQTHIVMGYRANENHLVKLYGDVMDKSYGIPNGTSEETRIEMEQKRYGMVVHTKNIFDTLHDIQTEVQYSDYNHYETEGGRYDGRFAQEQTGISSRFEFDVSDWQGEAKVDFLAAGLRVCHEHGQCREFQIPIRTDAEDGRSVSGYFNDTGIAYSHGHPMPDTKEAKSSAAWSLSKPFEQDEISFGANITARHLGANPDNIQEEWLMPESIDGNYYDAQDDFALSFSSGWFREWNDYLSSQASLAYIERLPSSQELFWNGFHHATESYILGNRDLSNERSVNFDFELLYVSTPWSTKFNTYYYHFDNYIYQSPMVDSSGTPLLDPFHGSSVWTMCEVEASIYGVGVQEQYSYTIKGHQLTTTAQLNALQGKIAEGGYLPRMSPYNASLEIEDKVGSFTHTIGYKWVDKSRNDAANETGTKGYDWLSAGVRWERKTSYGDWEVWLKGENLTDSIALNHLSFLKETAPLPGRQISMGIIFKY